MLAVCNLSKMSFTFINFSSSSVTLDPRRRTEVGGHWKLWSSEDAVRERTRKDNGMQIRSPAWQMRWQLQQHSDMQPSLPCSTREFCRCSGEKTQGHPATVGRSAARPGEGGTQHPTLTNSCPTSEANPSSQEYLVYNISVQETLVPGRN